MSESAAGGSSPPARVLIAKVGLDGHDRGAHVVARAFRDSGFEVIYSGLHNTPDEIVNAVVQEDVDVLGISILSGAHNTVVPDIVDGLEEYGVADDVMIVVGGTIPDQDREDLFEEGVDEIFGPGTDTGKAVEYVRENLES
ncbi:MAG: cobalamin B12-binding domain-containing protein [Halobacteria archaeon]